MAIVPRSVRGRVFLGFVAAILLSLGVVALAVPGIARDHEIDVLGARLESDASLAADLGRDAFRTRDAEVLDALAHRIAADAQIRVTFIGSDGVVLGESDEDRRVMENHATRPEVVPALGGGVGRTVRHSATVGRDLLYVAVPVRDAGSVIGVARVAFPLVSVDALAARLAASLIAGAALAAVIAFALSWLVARAVTRPIERITEVAERDAIADVGDVSGPEEVQRLAASLRRAAASVRMQREAVAAERDHLATLIDELADAVVILDAEGRVELANAAASGMRGGDLVGRGAAEVFREHEALAAIAAAHDGEEQITTIERSEPRRFVRVVARQLGAGRVLVVEQDLTNLRRLETMRSDFVANVSHELRRPISSLKAMAETLEEGALDDPAAARDFVGRMHREIDGLAQLVNELLALTRLESRAEALELRPIAPSQLLRDVARRMGPLASRAGVALVADPTRAADVLADPDRIGQVLANLVHNAVKFTPPGGTVRLGAEDVDGAVAIRVADTGVGIASEDLERVFERFYKADRARAGEGTGLGLAIAKHIAQAHGGTIEAHSAGPGRGATFTLTLPAAR